MMMETEDGGNFNGNRKLTWQELRTIIQSNRKSQQAIACQVPHTFTFRTFYDDNHKPNFVRIYFLAALNGSRENTICYYDVTGQVSGSCPPGDQASWKRILEPLPIPGKSTLSREEQLLRERKRMSQNGITSYDVDTNCGKFLFPAASSLFTFNDTLEGTVAATEVKTSTKGPRMDAKLCPDNPDLVSFVNNSDLWVTHTGSGSEVRLTHAHRGTGRLEDDPISAGVPSFIVQEEFDRYTGYWWQPRHDKGSNKYRILYEEVDESEVDIISIISQSDGHDDYRYPKAGTVNARSQLKLVEFTLDDSNQITEVHMRELIQDPDMIFPDVEYLVRADWTLDGQYVHAQLLNRAQSHLRLVMIHVDSFLDSPSQEEVAPLSVDCCLIYEDKSDIWINVTDVLYFLPSSRGPGYVTFIWLSEKTGYKHLYKITTKLTTKLNLANSERADVIEEVALTSGDWEVSSKQIWVDESRGRLYFMGYKNTPLESHLYSVSYTKPGAIVLLTALRSSHLPDVDTENNLFVTVESSVSVTPSCDVYQISHTDAGGLITQRLLPLLTASVPSSCYRIPELFNFVNKDGVTIYGMIYKPKNYQPGRKYPTVLFVYGGPCVQLVTNSYKGSKLQRLHTLAQLDYTVVVIDGRGSDHRGLKFEGHIKHRMGCVEIEDQVEGLHWMAGQVDCIDLRRVAIHGWSYGGYVSLLGIIQRPDVFKIAIAGAPVTHWNHYDTGYSERYMSTPEENPFGYIKGSILAQADQFPDEEHRLCLVHGLIDENVHFTHTKMLCNALIKACKPFDVKVYPSERHGIRSQVANEHYDTAVASYLQEFL